MKRTSLSLTARAALAVLALGVLAGCKSGSSSSSDAATSTAASTAASASAQAGGTGAAAGGGDCAAFAALMKSNAASLSSTNAATIGALAAKDQAAAGTFSNPKLKEAATKMAEYYQQEAGYAKNPSGAQMPDSSLMNTATEDYAEACVPHS